MISPSQALDQGEPTTGLLWLHLQGLGQSPLGAWGPREQGLCLVPRRLLTEATATSFHRARRSEDVECPTSRLRNLSMSSQRPYPGLQAPCCLLFGGKERATALRGTSALSGSRRRRNSLGFVGFKAARSLGVGRDWRAGLRLSAPCPALPLGILTDGLPALLVGLRRYGAHSLRG